MDPAPRSNIELKARLASLDAARRVAEQVATERVAPEHQIDTYFHCRTGRLKLREINGERGQLISYERPDRADAKRSRYFMVPAPEPALLKEALAAALGVRVVVDKRREIYLHRNVRIHLDVVQGLGTFLEFEAVLESAAEEPAGRALVRELQQRFEISENDLLTGSYSDLLERR